MIKRSKVGGKIEGQDIDVSVSGIVYVTTRSHDRLSDIPEGDGTYYSSGEEGHEVDHIKCELYKYNPKRKLFEQVNKYGKKVLNTHKELLSQKMVRPGLLDLLVKIIISINLNRII